MIVLSQGLLTVDLHQILQLPPTLKEIVGLLGRKNNFWLHWEILNALQNNSNEKRNSIDIVQL